jgi:LCP family protein required for cell wall assembly
MPGRRRHRTRSSCLTRLFSLLVPLVLSLVLGIVAGGYILWRWSATLPRTNVLILGLDRRPEEGYVVRSDTMILASFYPAGPAVTMLSIPRDLYVEIPGYGSDRINTAHFWGESEFEGGGPVLATQTILLNFGVPVHHYVRVDFEAFRALVDAVGGIDVTVEAPIVDEAYPTEDYGTMRIEIPAGLQRMNGETALRYARTRHGSSDFDRIARQQKVVMALASRLLKPAVWPRLPLVYHAVRQYVDTDMSDGDMLLLAITMYRLGVDKIECRAIDREMTQPWTTPAGGSVLLPRWEAIHPLIQELFTP